MELIKVIFSGLLAVTSLLVFLLVRDKSFEVKVYRAAITGGILFKFLLCIVIYSFLPNLNRDSDAALYYLPETLKVLSGQIPYKDFESSYSILFHLLLLPAVSFWRSVGSIALTMLLFEGLMIFVYLRRCREKDWEQAWRVVFLYSFSPISFYWIALTGYNGSIIACFAMLSLVLAEERRNSLSGIAGALGFLLSKLLMVLTWPGIIFFSVRTWVPRIIPLLLSVLVLASLNLFNIDISAPIRREFLESTSGNIWFLVSVIAPDIKTASIWSLLPIFSFAAFFLPLFVLFLKSTKSAETEFDTAVAFIATTNLLFMVLSRKSYTFYLPMMLIFVIHALIRQNEYVVKRLIPLAFLGATTTLEPYLWDKVRSQAQPFTIFSPVTQLFILDLITVGCYIYWINVCFKTMTAQLDKRQITDNSPY